MPPATTNGSAQSARAGTVARVASITALAVSAALIGALLLHDGGKGRYRLEFQNAGQLVKGDDVQVGGRRVGSVEAIELTSNNHAEVEVEIEDSLAPLHEGTTAVIRATSLSGIANRYVALTPGPNNARKLEYGATLPTQRTTTPVDLDQLFNTLDDSARRSLQEVIQGSATQYAGQGDRANRSARYLSPALSNTDQLVSELIADQRRFTDFVVNSSKLVTAVAERRSDLSSLIANVNATARAIARQNAAFGASLDLLPRTLRRASSTFVNLRSTLDDLDVLVAESKPATRRLAPFLRQLRPLVADARPTIADLRRLVGEPGPSNDLTDAVRKLPRLQAIASPTSRRTIAALRRSQPVLQFARPYAPELVGWFRDFGQGASNYDANGHFARIQPMFNAYSLNSSGVLVPSAPSQRYAGLQSGQLRRCPGAASQPSLDGSAPFLDTPAVDCDPSLVPPGP